MEKLPSGHKKERKNISGRIRKVHGLVNCIGVIDGTLFPLAFAPTVNAEDCFTRKGVQKERRL